MATPAHNTNFSDVQPSAKAIAAEGAHPDDPHFYEFVALMALMMSMVAFSVDAMLPALLSIGQELQVTSQNDTQHIVSSVLFGLIFGQLFFSPLSDSVGRKPTMYVGVLVYIAGGLMAVFAESFAVLLAGRFLQGFGAAGPRFVGIAAVRDRFAGRYMAKVMSFVLSVFIIVPALAPLIGQGVLELTDDNWRWIFGMCVALGVVAFVWLMRLPESLPVEKRHPLSLTRMWARTKEVVTTKTSMAYTVMAGLVFGGFIGFLTTAQLVFGVHFNLGDNFPILFTLCAISMGVASWVNGRIVVRMGMEWVVVRALWTVLSMSIYMGLWVAFVQPNPPLWLWMCYLLPTMFGIGLLFGNLNAMAMEPLGHIAGIGSAVVGAISTTICVSAGAWIGQQYNDSVLPIVTGLAFCSWLSLIVLQWARGWRFP